jgi:hypothetical protein
MTIDWTITDTLRNCFSLPMTLPREIHHSSQFVFLAQRIEKLVREEPGHPPADSKIGNACP